MISGILTPETNHIRLKSPSRALYLVKVRKPREERERT